MSAHGWRGHHVFIEGVLTTVTALDIATLRCSIPVLPGGDGADTAPLDERTEHCRHQSSVMIGLAPICEHHLHTAARVSGCTYEYLAADLPVLPCPAGGQPAPDREAPI